MKMQKKFRKVFIVTYVVIGICVALLLASVWGIMPQQHVVICGSYIGLVAVAVFRVLLWIGQGRDTWKANIYHMIGDLIQVAVWSILFSKYLTMYQTMQQLLP